jgi:hypothetical protein
VVDALAVGDLDGNASKRIGVGADQDGNMGTPAWCNAVMLRFAAVKASGVP